MEATPPKYGGGMSMEEFLEWLNECLKRQVEELGVMLKRIEKEINGNN